MRRKNTRSLIAGAAAALLLLLSTGCSPRVYTRIRTNHPPRIEGATVLVYDTADSLPGETEVVGSLRIKDTGFSTGCGYPAVMQLAREATNRAGGNGLHITRHDEPSVWGSTCHQIAADMLLLPDSVYTASYFDNILAQQVREAMFSERRYPKREDNPKDRTLAFHQKRVWHALTVDFGYSAFTREIDLPDGVFGTPQAGFDLSASYQATGRSGLGGGIRYAGYFSSFESTGLDYRVRMHYIAPEFVVRRFITRKCEFRGTVGIGYVHYREAGGEEVFPNGQFKRINGFGFHLQLGIDYRLSPAIGIGLSLTEYYARFRSADALVEFIGYNGTASIPRLALDAGLRFYF